MYRNTFNRILEGVLEYQKLSQQSPTIKKSYSTQLLVTPNKIISQAFLKQHHKSNSKSLKKIISTVNVKKKKAQIEEKEYGIIQNRIVINQPCILCHESPSDARLACAHSCHQACFLGSFQIPLCRICQSKNKF